MICEIINPSDPYTLKTDNFVAAGLAIAVLGSGQMGLKSEDGKSTPILFGWDYWLNDNGINSIDSYISDNRLIIIEILNSVMTGGVEERREVELELSLIENEDDRSKFLSERHERCRTSLNNIGLAAWTWAAKLNKAMEGDGNDTISSRQ